MKQVCVVLDANIWRSSLMLKSNLGHALVYRLMRQNQLLGLPFVVEKELRKLVVEYAMEEADRYERSGRTLETLTNHGFLPPSDDFEASIDERLEFLNPIIKRVPFNFEQSKNALEMVLNKEPPNALKTSNLRTV